MKNLGLKILCFLGIISFFLFGDVLFVHAASNGEYLPFTINFYAIDVDNWFIQDGNFGPGYSEAKILDSRVLIKSMQGNLVRSYDGNCYWYSDMEHSNIYACTDVMFLEDGKHLIDDKRINLHTAMGLEMLFQPIVDEVYEYNLDDTYSVMYHTNFQDMGDYIELNTSSKYNDYGLNVFNIYFLKAHKSKYDEDGSFNSQINLYINNGDSYEYLDTVVVSEFIYDPNQINSYVDSKYNIVSYPVSLGAAFDNGFSDPNPIFGVIVEEKGSKPIKDKDDVPGDDDTPSDDENPGDKKEPDNNIPRTIAIGVSSAILFVLLSYVYRAKWLGFLFVPPKKRKEYLYGIWLSLPGATYIDKDKNEVKVNYEEEFHKHVLYDKEGHIVENVIYNDTLISILNSKTMNSTMFKSSLANSEYFTVIDSDYKMNVTINDTSMGELALNQKNINKCIEAYDRLNQGTIVIDIFANNETPYSIIITK